MRTIMSRTMLAGLALLALTTGAAAQSRSTQPNSNVREAGLEISLAQPTALTTGENQFEVIVKGADGQPINDAVVSVVLTTDRIPATGWLWKELKLTRSGDGMYAGSGKLPRAPKWAKWETTIQVKKDGKKVGQKKVTLTVA